MAEPSDTADPMAGPADKTLDLVWGADAIAKLLNLKTRRQAFYLLEKGDLPARKVGGQWVASRRKLREHFEDV